MMKFDEKYCLDIFNNLINIDSTTGQYADIQKYVSEIIEEMGYSYECIHKGGLIADLGGEGNPLVLSVHLDTLGLMVRHINSDGTLNVCPIGALFPVYCIFDDVRIYTRDNRIYNGTVCRTPNSLHVTEEEVRDTPGDFRKNICVVLDEDVHNAEDVRKLGIETGDIIALDPRFKYVNGYLKSRFVDDKACVVTLLTVMKTIRENGLKLNRRVYAYFSAYEEVGHGTAYLPEGIKDILAIDIAPTGPEQNSDEHKVSVFAKDSLFPYHYEMTNELRDCAIRNNIDYVMDVFTPHYSTDSDVSILAGYDIRHAAIGPGTSNSHGYERTHIQGLENTYKLILSYISE